MIKFSLRNLLIVGAAFVFGWLGHFWLTNVSEPDVYAFHDYTLPIAPRDPLRPGDIVAVSPKGKISRICSLKRFDADDQSVTTSIYYNSLDESWDRFISAVKSAGSVVGLGGEASAEAAGQLRHEFIFRGANLVVDDLSASSEFEESDCERSMAIHMVRGFRPCTVRQSLISVTEDDTGALRRETVALSLANWVNYVSPDKFAEMQIEYTATAERVAGESCARDTLPFDARIRRWVGAIEREPFRREG